jgi:hypothetical protein
MNRQREVWSVRFRSQEPEPVRGQGSFQWNSNGWMGCQFGTSAWMLVGALELLSKDRNVAALWFACFVFVNSIGRSLWSRRAKVYPFHAFEALLLVALMAGLFAWFFTVAFRPDLMASLRTGRDTGALTLAVIPCLMTWFWILERHSLKDKQIDLRSSILDALKRSDDENRSDDSGNRPGK